MIGASSGEGGPPARAEDESALVERVRGGDVAAFDELVQRHMKRAYAVAYRLLGHREDAEDLVQDAFIQALDRIDTFEAGRPFAPWFFRILTNRGLNARQSRALRTMSELPEDVAGALVSPERAAERADLAERLRDAVAKLPERQQLIVQLFEIDGWTSAEIAATLGIADGTVRWHVHEARRALRAELEPYRDEASRGK
ncbi:MAG: sigma-70 family RNA polymerase sigma factor [Gemmatimonadaceae bacterium]|nr:sigma-70 family RNA polymerase sigma factor [Gemmatimonadaceae bacterium]NUQ93617.1 sigma-70 family RNA polymerase sigma factor [Gemmatimonadaceae bacterium]NUR19525.1 sigma-70 family RNA polymerase sigma factor [Gemmatimonadaceae bacterium]NUS95827.1 sigma-70 family RNA polymerase sigma factor [Gemmatimonadaceae bacterium]